MTRNPDVTPGAGLNRRVVVQGAVWSLPLITAVVAAPAAAASMSGAKVSFSPSPEANGLRLTSMNNDDPAVYSATGPSYFTITNGPSAIVGPVTGTITVAQSSNYLQKPKGVGVKTVEDSTVYTPKFTESPAPKAETGTTTFSYPSGVQASSSLKLAITFGYKADYSLTTATATATAITYTATLSLTDSRGVQIGEEALASLSTNFILTS